MRLSAISKFIFTLEAVFRLINIYDLIVLNAIIYSNKERLIIGV